LQESPGSSMKSLSSLSI